MPSVHPYSETVSGHVIGPISHEFRVIQPNGTITNISEYTTEDAIATMKEMKRIAFSLGPKHIIEMAYGKGEWKLEEKVK